MQYAQCTKGLLLSCAHRNIFVFAAQRNSAPYLRLVLLTAQLVLNGSWKQFSSAATSVTSPL